MKPIYDLRVGGMRVREGTENGDLTRFDTVTQYDMLHRHTQSDPS